MNLYDCSPSFPFFTSQKGGANKVKKGDEGATGRRKRNGRENRVTTRNEWEREERGKANTIKITKINPTTDKKK